MGAGQSTANDSHPPGRALHVLRVTPSSPASQANIEAFFDFVVGFEGDSLASRKALDAAELERLVESHEGKSLKLLVWNSKTQDTRGARPSTLVLFIVIINITSSGTHHALPRVVGSQPYGNKPSRAGVGTAAITTRTQHADVRTGVRG